MRINDRISKEEFDIASDNHMASKWIKFAFKYFSNSTLRKDFAVKNTVVNVLIGLFFVGLAGTIFNAPTVIVKTTVIAYSLLLAALVLYLFSAVMVNNHRINLIRKELGITKSEYDALVQIYYT